MALFANGLHTCNAFCAGEDHYEVLYATVASTPDTIRDLLTRHLDPHCHVLSVQAIAEYRHHGTRVALDGSTHHGTAPILAAYGVRVRWE